jgi:hypothetical protein
VRGRTHGAMTRKPASSLADFNKDGKLDVATGNVDGNDTDDDVVAAALGNGNGTFQAPVFKSSGGDCPLSLETGDYGRDARHTSSQPVLQH